MIKLFHKKDETVEFKTDKSFDILNNQTELHNISSNTIQFLKDMSIQIEGIIIQHKKVNMIC